MNKSHEATYGGSYGNEILYKYLDLAQNFPKILVHFLWVKMLPKKSPKIFRWPEMCPLGKILAQDFEIAAVRKILGWRDKSIVPLLSTKNCKHSKQKRTQHVRRWRWLQCSDSQSCCRCDSCTEPASEVGSGDEGLGLLCASFFRWSFPSRGWLKNDDTSNTLQLNVSPDPQKWFY